MDLITSDEVIRRIQLYVTGGTVHFLTPGQVRAVKTALAESEAHE
jgi:hypothetical protein